MKYLLILLIVFAGISCSGNSINSPKNINNDGYLVGKWANDNIIVIFNANGTGIYKEKMCIYQTSGLNEIVIRTEDTPAIDSSSYEYFNGYYEFDDSHNAMVLILMSFRSTPSGQYIADRYERVF